MKLKWPGFSEQGSVIISLAHDAVHIPKNILVLQDTAFTIKDELHVTLLGSKLGSVLKEKTTLHQGTEKWLKQTFESIDWSFRQTGPVHILSRKKGRNFQQTIIMLIEMHGFNHFYSKLRSSGIIDSDTPVPPPHITLFTYNCQTGISVPSIEALKELSAKTFSLDDFNSLLSKGEEA